MEIRQVEARERLAAVPGRRRLDGLERTSIERLVGQALQRRDVDLDVRRVQPDADPVGHEAAARLVVDELPELREAPAQRATRVVGDLPEQLAQLFPAKRAPVERQVGEQRAGLLRGRQGQALAGPDDLDFAQKLQFQR